MSRKIRIGVLSFAHYHARFWSEVFRDSPLAEFVGIWDEDKTRGAAAAETYRTRFWPDLEPLAPGLRGCRHNLGDSPPSSAGRGGHKTQVPYPLREATSDKSCRLRRDRGPCCGRRRDLHAELPETVRSSQSRN